MNNDAVLIPFKSVESEVPMAYAKLEHKDINGNRIVCANSPTLSDVLRSLENSDTLYVQGQCSANPYGDTLLYNYPGARKGEGLQVSQLTTLLNGILPPNFEGKIVLYGSGTGLMNTSYSGGSSFALRLAKELDDIGRRSCTLYSEYYGDILQVK